MSEIPNDPVFQRKTLSGSNEPLKKTRNNQSSSAKASTSQKAQDTLDLSKADQEKQAVSEKDQLKIAKWVDMLMDEEQFPDIRRDKVEEAKEKVKFGYDNEDEVLKETAKAIAKELGLN